MERPGRAAVVNTGTLGVSCGPGPTLCTTIILHYGQYVIIILFIIILGEGKNGGNASFTKAQFLEH